MTGASALLLGLGLGLRHAADADHVVVVSALLDREHSVARAARTAALWGAGHSLSFLAVGLLIVLAGLRAPPVLELAAELLVIAMLLGFGAHHAWRGIRPRREPSSSPGAERLFRARPLLVGMVHGVAGSAGVALLATSAMESQLWAAAYLALFGLGSVGGMVLLTIALSWSLQRTKRLGSMARASVALAPAALSLTLGLLLLAGILNEWTASDGARQPNVHNLR